MAAVYDTWEKLVNVTLRREELRESAMESQTPSELSSPSFNSNLAQASVLLVGDSFTVHQILRATDFLNDESNLIRRGHSEDFYYGVLESWVQVVVKRVSVSTLEKELCFLSEMEIYGMLQRDRLIPVLGYCSENANDKFLVYKYMHKQHNKDLSRFVAGSIDGDRQPTTPLDWTTRLKIATGALEGLRYLHHQCSPPLVPTSCSQSFCPSIL